MDVGNIIANINKSINATNYFTIRSLSSQPYIIYPEPPIGKSSDDGEPTLTEGYVGLKFIDRQNSFRFQNPYLIIFLKFLDFHRLGQFLP